MGPRDFSKFEKLFPKVGAVLMDGRRFKRGTDTKLVVVTKSWELPASMCDGGQVWGFEFFGDLEQIRDLVTHGHLRWDIGAREPRVYDGLGEVWWDARARCFTANGLRDTHILIANPPPLKESAPIKKKRKKS